MSLAWVVRRRRRRHLRVRRDVRPGRRRERPGAPSTWSASASGPAAGWRTCSASFVVTLLTFIAEIGGVALAFELVTGVNYLLLVPFAAFAGVARDLAGEVRARWRRSSGSLGLALIVFAVAVWQLGPDWGQLLHAGRAPGVPSGEGHPTYCYYAIALFGAAMTPYEVFFFSSGGVEEKWTRKDLGDDAGQRASSASRSAALLSLAIMALRGARAAAPAASRSSTLARSALPVAVALGQGRAGVRASLGFFAATFGAALRDRPVGRLHGRPVLRLAVGQVRAPARGGPVPPASILVSTVARGRRRCSPRVDPVKVTEYSIVFSAAALPLTYFPILVVANDPDYMGDDGQRTLANTLGMVYLVILDRRRRRHDPADDHHEGGAMTRLSRPRASQGHG